MKTKSPILTKEERDALILAATHPYGQFLSNTEIAKRRGVSVNRVKTIVHQACVKLGAHNRGQAILFAIRRGDINLTEFSSLDEVTELVIPLGPDVLIEIAHCMRQGVEPGHPPRKGKRIGRTGGRRHTILTERERKVLILVGKGLANKEIADRLHIPENGVRRLLERACHKLGAHKRADAFLSALNQREICVGEIASLKDIVEYLAPFGSVSIEKIAAQLVSQELRQELVPTGS